MSEHVAKTDIERFKQNRLSAVELLRVDRHLSACESCRMMANSNPGTLGSAGRFLDRLSGEFGNHLTYEQFEGLIDARLDPSERRLADRHLEICVECADELESIREMSPPLIPEATPSGGHGFSSFFALRWVPVTVGIALLFVSGIGLIYILRPGDDVAKAVDSVPEVVIPTANVEATPEPLGESVDPNPEPSIALNDGGVTIGIDADGRLLGLDELSPASRQSVERAMRSGTIVVGKDANEVRTANGSLMGSGGTSLDGFNIVGPSGKVILSDRPTLSWKSVGDVTGYRVDIYDSNYAKVTSSPVLQSNSWTTQLPRGRTYVWQVTAVKDGEEFKAPSAAEPEARFRIVDARRSAEIESIKTKYPRSHLALAIAYADAGLVSDALRELESVSRSNPNSNLVRRMIKGLRSGR